MMARYREMCEIVDIHNREDSLGGPLLGWALNFVKGCEKVKRFLLGKKNGLKNVRLKVHRFIAIHFKAKKELYLCFV